MGPLGVIWFRWGHEGGAHMVRSLSLLEEKENRAHFLSREDIARNQPSTSHKQNPRQKPSHAGHPDLGLPSLPQSVALCYSSLSTARQALNAIANLLIRERQRKIRHRRGRGNVTTEAKVGVMWLQAKECPQPPEAGWGKGQVFL